MVLSEGTVKLRLEHGGVLLGLCEFFLQCFRPEHGIAVSLEHLRFLSGSLHDILQQTTTVIRVLSNMADRLLKGTDNLASSTAQPGALPPGCALLPPGRRDRPPEVRFHHE
jgi:hypothetical protein